MSLRIIYGRAGSGKSCFCFEDIKDRLRGGQRSPLILIVPEQFSLQAELKLVETLGGSGINKAEVLSFRRLSYRVLSDVGGINRSRINQIGKSMLLYRVMDKVRDQLKIFGASAGKKGFVSEISSIISEMKRYNVTLADLENAVSVYPAKHQQSMEVGRALESDPGQAKSNLHNKMEDIGLIFQEFEKALSEGYADADDDLTILAQKLDKCKLFDAGEIWIDGFAGFTPQEFRVIEGLMKKVQRINITLCMDCIEDEHRLTGVELFAPTQHTAYKLIKAAREAGIKVEAPISTVDMNIHRSQVKGLQHLEGNLYAFPSSSYTEQVEGLSIFKAAAPYTEVEDTARDIVRLCREEDYKFGEIAVVTGDLDSYENIVKAVFTQYGIPHFIDNKRAIMGHPLIAMVLSVLQLQSSNWNYEVVFRYLKTGLSGITREDVDILENYVLANGIRGSRWTREQPWSYKAQPVNDNLNEYEESITKKVNEIRYHITAPITEFHGKLKGRKTVRDICTALFEMLCDIKVPEQLEALIQGFKNKGQLYQANEYSQIWNMFVEVLDQLVDIAGDDYITMEKYCELLEIGLGECKMGLIPPALEQVMVGSIERSKSHALKAIYILGVNDGVFPTAPVNEGLLSDVERESLKLLGIELAPDTRSRAFEQQFIAYNVLCTPSNFLRLSYPVSNSEGKTLRASSVINKLKRIFPKLDIQTDIVLQNFDNKNVCTAEATFNELIGAMRKKAEGYEISPWWRDVYHWYMSQQSWREKFQSAAAAFQHTNQVNQIDKERTKKLYGANINTSISRLEKYISCPFSYYLQYGLKAKERKIFKLTAPDMGTFLHEVLDRFSRVILENRLSWRTIDRQWCVDTVNEIVRQMLDELKDSIFTGSRRYAYLTERLKRLLVRAVWIIAEQIKRGGFEPIGYEMGFGTGEEMPPITIELPDGERIILNGRIDRVDAFKAEEGTYIRVIDYKSGSKAFKLSDVFYGLQIQLLTYLDAIWQNGLKEAEGPVLPAGMLYFKIDDPIIKGGRELEDEDIEREIMKQLKMKGLLLADVKLIREMDRQMEGDSHIIPARINKGEVLGRSSAATLEQFEILRRHVKELLVKIGTEMLSGNITINPYKKKRVTACGYCSYLSVCQFDTSMKDNKYRLLNDWKDDEIWKLMGGESNE